MFDNPKKELERLEQQLLAAEEDVDAESAEEFDELFCDEIYEDSEEEYVMDEDRYVPPKKKGIQGLLIIACLEIAAIIALALWWLEQLR